LDEPVGASRRGACEALGPPIPVMRVGMTGGQARPVGDDFLPALCPIDLVHAELRGYPPPAVGVSQPVFNRPGDNSGTSVWVGIQILRTAPRSTQYVGNWKI